MAKHTPEPWTCTEHIIYRDAPHDATIAVCYGTSKPANNDVADANRIVDCVNAMAGIEDPLQFIRSHQAETIFLDKAINFCEQRDDVTVGDSYIDHVIKLAGQRDQLLEQLEKLLDMHCREQEAMMPPTPSEWFNAVNQANEVLEKCKAN